MSVRASCAGLRCSQEQTGAGSSNCEDQQQFRMGLLSGAVRYWIATVLLEVACDTRDGEDSGANNVRA